MNVLYVVGMMWCLGLCSWCIGCADLSSLAADLNARQVKGCGVITGAYGPFVTAKIDVLTGGMTVEECNALR